MRLVALIAHVYYVALLYTPCVWFIGSAQFRQWRGQVAQVDFTSCALFIDLPRYYARDTRLFFHVFSVVIHFVYGVYTRRFRIKKALVKPEHYQY